MGGTTDARIVTHSALLLLAGPPGCLPIRARILWPIRQGCLPASCVHIVMVTRCGSRELAGKNPPGKQRQGLQNETEVAQAASTPSSLPSC